MRKKLRVIVVLAVVVALLPYTGLPVDLKQALTTLVGAGVVVFAVLARRNYAHLKERLSEGQEPKKEKMSEFKNHESATMG